MKKVRADMKVDKFQEFADLTSETIITGVRLKMSEFLNEDLALTDRWGKTTFIGSSGAVNILCSDAHCRREVIKCTNMMSL